MFNTFKTLIRNQFEAALCMLDLCIDRCPESDWDAPVVNLKFCQVAFHTLFFTDYYLGHSQESFRVQQFHIDNQEFFRDYEELQDRKQEFVYDRPTTKRYLEFCRDKAAKVIAAETSPTLDGPSGFERRDVSRAELHVYSMRHIQHHAAQLSLRLRISTNEDIPWIGSGWRET